MKDLQRIDDARDEVSASSCGGAAFLICFGTTLIATGVASVFIDRKIAALVATFQGAVALPASFMLERKIGSMRLSDDNPLKTLSVQLAMSQVVALPAAIVAYSMNPNAVPVVLAAIGGGHFLPYAWLQRTKVYLFLGAGVSLGAFAIQIAMGKLAFPYILLFMGLFYWAVAPVVYRDAARLVERTG